MSTHRYAIVTGQGRSGTNWLLDVLDASPETFCRNEPNAIPTSPFADLGPLWKVGARDELLADRWDDIVAWTCTHQGERDHRIDTPKAYVHGWSSRLGLPPLVARPRIRRTLSVGMPSLRAGEWPLPRWVGDRAGLASAFAVLKINRVPMVAAWLLENRPGVPILNIVRHPGGRHRSWSKRFLAGRDRAEVEAASRAVIAEIAAHDPRWAALFGPLDAMTLVEQQTWFWRYVTETLHDAGSGRADYHLIVYEDMVDRPTDHAKAAYAACGLEWTEDIAARVAAGLDDSVWGRLPASPREVARAWKSELDRADIDAIERILATSPMARWWDGLA